MAEQECVLDGAERDEALRSLWKGTPEGLIAKLPRGNVQLDYLGHADTCRLIAEVDPYWQWEPDPAFAALWGEEGAVVRNDSGYPVRLYIKLTILGISRPGIGSVLPGKSDPEKELIGDSIRNAAMRFGIGADLWSKAKGDDPDSKEGTYHRGEKPKRAPEPKTADGVSPQALAIQKQAAAAGVPEDVLLNFIEEVTGVRDIGSVVRGKTAQISEQIVAWAAAQKAQPTDITSLSEAPEKPSTALCPGGCGWEPHNCRCAPEKF